MLAQVSFVIDPILYFFLIEQSHLCSSKSLNASNIVRVVMLLLVVKIADLVVIDVLFF